MPRKIAPRKHHGVKDPMKQKADREEKIKDKINNPPKDFESQEVSKKFKQFVAMKTLAKKPNKMTGKVRTVNDDFKDTGTDMERIRKQTNENHFKFLRRIDKVTRERRMEAQYAAKYNVDIVRNQDTGEIKLKKRPKDELTDLMQQKRAEASGNKKLLRIRAAKEAKANVTKLTSLQKMKLKKKENKLKKQNNKSVDTEEFKRDEFKFGEFVQAPPTLVIPKKALKLELTVPRPGARNLLLSSMMGETESGISAKPAPSAISSKIFGKPINKKGKRKNLPQTTRMALEQERENVVELYRQMKKKQPIIPIANKNLDEF